MTARHRVQVPLKLCPSWTVKGQEGKQFRVKQHLEWSHHTLPLLTRTSGFQWTKAMVNDQAAKRLLTSGMSARPMHPHRNSRLHIKVHHVHPVHLRPRHIYLVSVWYLQCRWEGTHTKWLQSRPVWRGAVERPVRGTLTTKSTILHAWKLRVGLTGRNKKLKATKFGQVRMQETRSLSRGQSCNIVPSPCNMMWNL